MSTTGPIRPTSQSGAVLSLRVRGVTVADRNSVHAPGQPHLCGVSGSSRAADWAAANRRLNRIYIGKRREKSAS